MKKSLPLTIAAAITITTQAQNVGIGEANPANKLSVKGNLSIGSGYSTTAAPADGAIIEGRVGIGTSSPSYPLTVERNLGVGSGQQILAGFTRLTSGAANGGLLLGYEGDGVSVVRSFIYAAGNQRDLVFQNFDGGLQNRMVISGTGQVGIGTITPDSKSILDVQSTTRGVFLARMTTAQRNAISGLGTSHTGLTIYNTDNNRYEFWDGDSWEPV
ncbi:MAG: hypothetical protein NZM35_11460, partial [Chitinophagales bacterium]|nr:hypothetical protein [Chitinophagales bacterium]